jgi:putative tryptophan/tyrosine transport system substrate-binding protein
MDHREIAVRVPVMNEVQFLLPPEPRTLYVVLLIEEVSPLSRAAATPNVGAFRKGLRDLGHVEGRNIALELRFAEGIPSRLPQLATELVALKPDVIVVGSVSGILATRDATQTVPLVTIIIDDPIALGLVKSIARPGTNVTGTWVSGDEGLVGKRLGLLKDVVPGLARVGAMVNPDEAQTAVALRLLPAAARALGLELHVIELREPSELEAAFSKAVRDGVQALYTSSAPFLLSHSREVVAIAARVRLPAMYGWREFAEAGGLISYGPNLPDAYRWSAGAVAKILNGASPVDLPIEIPTRFELVVNLKAAKALAWNAYRENKTIASVKYDTKKGLYNVAA